MKILFLSRWYPFPPDNGSKIRIFNLLRYLAEKHEVDLISFAAISVSNKRIQAAKKYCANVSVIQYRNFDPRHWKALLGFFSKKPRSIVQTYNLGMEECITDAINQNDYDVVIASQIDMLPYVEKINGPTKILEELELAPFSERVAKEGSVLEKLRRRIAWGKLTHYIKLGTKDISGVTVVSNKEKAIVDEVLLQSTDVCVVPNTVDIEVNSVYGDTKKTSYPSLIFNGALSFYVNFDAMKYFINEIFPKVQQVRPDVKLLITGSLSGVDLSNFPKNEGVVFTGYLEDIRKAVAESWVCVVPIRLGGGTRLKILEALSLRTPVVATSKGAEGLDLSSGEDYLLGDTPHEFGEQVIQLIQNEDIRNRISQTGFTSVKAKYNWRRGGDQLEKFICKITESNVNS